MLKYWGIKTGKRFFFARFYMRSLQQRKDAAEAAHGGAASSGEGHSSTRLDMRCDVYAHRRL